MNISSNPGFVRTGRLVSIYLVLGALWILLSDRLPNLYPGLEVPVWYQTAKGLLFVAVTGALLAGLLSYRNRQLRRSEQFSRKILDAVPAMVWIGVDEGSRVWFNQRWLDHTGVNSSEAERRWVDLVHPDDRDELLSVTDRSRVLSTPYRVRYRLRRAAGTYEPVEERAFPYEGVSNQPLLYVGLCTPVSD